MLGETPGDQVVHTFCSKSVYCIQTVQWACGIPVGWGKCYQSESLPQVLSILDRIWSWFPHKQASFLIYDQACDLFQHIVTQNPQSSWLTSTKFIVDAWHYIGHQTSDLLCCLWCNPAPANGSQPDLILTSVDDNGNVHSTYRNSRAIQCLVEWLWIAALTDDGH